MNNLARLVRAIVRIGKEAGNEEDGANIEDVGTDDVANNNDCPYQYLGADPEKTEL